VVKHWWNRIKDASTLNKVGLGLTVCALIGYTASLPERIFNESYSAVLEASDGQLLSATIAADGQWRFPEIDSVPSRFAEALIAFEDKRFYYHPGVDPLSMGRALIQNISEGKVVSGGSTITMQVIRLSRKSSSRNVLEKIVEMILATRLELAHSKGEILSMYASHAPFGGNVVGLEAACWRYFGRGSSSLSWAEASLLAVLPNAPALVHPGKNRELLRAKRDRLLDRLRLQGAIDSLTCSLSKQEALPENPKPLPRHARHLLARMQKQNGVEKRMTSTIDHALQVRVEETLQQHHERLKSNRIYNGAALILDVKTGRVLAYAGNVRSQGGQWGEEVDVITSPRSTGSILKPFLFAAALDEGLILPRTLLPDIPVIMNGFSPRNFSREYDGAVHADEALIRSLNIPSVFLLRDYRYEKFFMLLKNLGVTTLQKPAGHYGLSLILGGAEATLWDLTGVYASMARTLNGYFQHPGRNRYLASTFRAPDYRASALTETPAEELQEASPLSAAAIYLTFESLKELYRPAEEAGWRYFSTSRKIAWKTGTSFGFRDGWAIGVNSDYAVGIWVGNADGEGRAGLTGTAAAAPLLFDVFALLPARSWFEAPLSEMAQIATCRKSGLRASAHCEETDSLWVVKRGLETKACSYHRTIHLSPDARFQVHSACADLASVSHVKWFVLPPVQEHYFRARNLSYRSMPPYRKDCEGARSIASMDMVYPEPDASILIPRDFNGKPGSSIFELAHRDAAAVVFWHLDGIFLGTTKGSHRLALNPGEGEHTLTVVDENGQSLEQRFKVISGL
jgi:penicillin-binding protein 1C